ncbi:hypothetical protein ONZ51_g11425 [Trametes cubensis]|uniref:Uncharacterized protein n=1 Tax=Trametes cubensis TaxID=1111947 RepID=A0AAD7X6C3_9APHY|nr:hypothetical protein ONZ51_g11425 [Trametes cubensis]
MSPPATPSGTASESVSSTWPAGTAASPPTLPGPSTLQPNTQDPSSESVHGPVEVVKDPPPSPPPLVAGAKRPLCTPGAHALDNGKSPKLHADVSAHKEFEYYRYGY